ncbi:hypothetical protein EG329_005493 [Mollisiaceae sp. DMI_Dod_QoI]|nr:hypothetical protein EG329_005493 [Helotiales sp. DMI_Dod_QoI]
MVEFRGLTWRPHLVDINRSKAPPRSRSFSVPNPAVHTDSSSQSFDGLVRRASLTSRPNLALPPAYAELQSYTSGTIQYASPAVHMAESSTNSEREGMSRTYANPPESSREDVSQDVKSHLPTKALSINCSVCVPVEETYDDLPPLPDSPLAIAKFGFISHESFNTSVRGLIQEEPDFPIGGYPAAPMSLANLDGPGGSNVRKLPRLEITSPQSGPCCDIVSERQPLIPRSRFSDPFSENLKKDKHARQATDPYNSPGARDSGYTTVMVTALETPVRRENTNISHDGAPESDVENVEPGAPLPECCMSPRSIQSENIVTYSLNGPEGVGKANVSQAHFGTSRPGNVPDIGLGKAALDGTGFQAPGGLDASNLGPSGIPNLDIGEPAAGLSGAVPTVAGVPADATGHLPAPGEPKRVGKRRRAVNKGKRAVRKGRWVVLRKPVLAVIVGRRLAGPTKEAIKLISQGVPVEPDVQGLTEAAGLPVPAAPPAPVPM